MQDLNDPSGDAGGAFYQETCQLGFQNNVYAPTSNADIMFAYEPDDQAAFNDREALPNSRPRGLDEAEVNYYTFQEGEKMAFTGVGREQQYQQH